MKAFAVISNAKVSSRQTCDRGDVWYVVEWNTAISLDKIRRSVKVFAVKSTAKVNS